MTAFDPLTRATWPELLTADEVAPIYRRKSGSAVIRAVQLHRFPVAPFQKYPYAWRRADVIRHLDSARGTLRRAG